MNTTATLPKTDSQRLRNRLVPGACFVAALGSEVVYNRLTAAPRLVDGVEVVDVTEYSDGTTTVYAGDGERGALPVSDTGYWAPLSAATWLAFERAGFPSRPIQALSIALEIVANK